MTKHAVYAVVAPISRPGISPGCVRIGRPTTWDKAQARWLRLDDRRRGLNDVPKRPVRVRHDGRWYRVEHLEVRAVDAFGRGLGAERHALALPEPYRAVRSALR